MSQRCNTRRQAEVICLASYSHVASGYGWLQPEIVTSPRSTSQGSALMIETNVPEKDPMFETLANLLESTPPKHTRNKCHATSNRCLTSSNKKLLETVLSRPGRFHVCSPLQKLAVVAWRRAHGCSTAWTDAKLPRRRLKAFYG